MSEDIVKDIRKQRGRWLVTLVSGDSFPVPLPMMRLHPLKPNQPLDRQAYQTRLAGEEYPHALERAAWLLSQRDYSVRALTEKLTDAGYAIETADKVRDYLLEQGFLDDKRYAQHLLEREKKRSGSRKMMQTLRVKGIDDEDARGALDSLSDEDELAYAYKQAEKYLSSKSLEPREAKQKAVAFLARRGYGYDIAVRAAQMALSPADETAEEE